MILWVHSNSAYLAELSAKSRVGSSFFLSNFVSDFSILAKATPHLNGPIHTICKILKNIIPSAAEYEIATAFKNRQDATTI